jgi:ribosomal protein S18 acetylase RimI-like enzyme
MHIQRVTHATPDFISQLNQELDDGMAWDGEQGQKFLANPDNALFVATVESVIVGFLTAYRLQRFDQRKAEVLLYEVGVNEAYQRRGIGKALIAAVKQWANEVEADEVWVLTDADNEAAMALYASTGGEEAGPGTRMFTYKL